MTIKEAESLSGVSSRNIRFYEKKGLLSPARNRDNDYREYSEADIQQLKLIRALRMVDMPIEQIKQISDGELPWREAVTQQRDLLKQKIRKIETEVRFCNELERADIQNIGEVLTRMDEPENRKFLSKNWPTDYAQTAKNILIPLGTGLVPLLLGLVFYIPMLICGLIAHGYALALALVLLICWIWQGYRMYQEKRWIGNFLLFSVFPLAALVLLLFGIPNDSMDIMFFASQNIPRLYFLHYSVPMEIVSVDFHMQSTDYLLCFALNIVSFAMGMLLRVAVNRSKAKQEEKKSALIRWFSARPSLQLALIYILVIVMLLVPGIVTNLGPEEEQVSPDNLSSAYGYYDSCYAKTKEGVVQFQLSEEFAKIARFEEWERKYTWIGFGQETLAIDKYDAEHGADLQFYSNDVVKVFYRGFKLDLGTTSYFRIPDGVLEAIDEYIQQNNIENSTK